MTFPEAIDLGFALSAFVSNVTITTAEAVSYTHLDVYKRQPQEPRHTTLCQAD